MDNFWTAWGDVFNQSLLDLWGGFVSFTPKLVIAIVFFVVGWVLGSIVSKAVEQVFEALKVDKLFQPLGVHEFFRKAGMNLNSGYFVGQVVKWFVVVIFLLPSLSLVFPPIPGQTDNVVTSFLKNDVLTFLPNVIVAALILIIAAVVSDGLSKTVTATAKSVNLSSANMIGVVVKYVVWVFAFTIALSQVGVAGGFMKALYEAIFQLFSLGGALALGLGAKDTVARFISKVENEVSHKG